jgi:PAS domain S-box-containing protein
MTTTPGPRATIMAAPASVPLRVTSTGLNELLALSPDALLLVDQAGNIVRANEQAATLFGYSGQEFGQLPLEALLPAHLRAAHQRHREHYLAAPRPRAMGAGLQLSGRRKDGSAFPVDISLRPVLLGEEMLTIGAVRDVSEQRRAERARAQQAEQLRLQAELLALSRDAILVRDSMSRVLFWNAGAEQLYGWTQQEALGRITHSLLKTRFSTSRADVDRHLAQDGSWEGELVHTCRDGRLVTVESRQAVVRDGRGRPTAVLEINRDRTERHRREQAAQAEHANTTAHLAFLQEVLDALPNAVSLVWGPDARLLLSNRAASLLWGAGWPADQPMLDFLTMHGITILDAQGQLLPPEHYATLRAAGQRETVLQHQETIRRPNGSALPVLVSAVALPTRRRWSGPLQEMADQQEDAREALALVIYQDVSALKEADSLKDEFISVAAHELRTPLAVLKGYASMLGYQTAQGKGADLSEWQREALREIEEGVARLDKLTEDLLDVTRLQAGRLILSRTPTDLVALTRHLVTQRQLTTHAHTCPWTRRSRPCRWRSTVGASSRCSPTCSRMR